MKPTTNTILETDPTGKPSKVIELLGKTATTSAGLALWLHGFPPIFSDRVVAMSVYNSARQNFTSGSKRIIGMLAPGTSEIYLPQSTDVIEQVYTITDQVQMPLALDTKNIDK